MKTYISKWKKLPRSIAREYRNGDTVGEIARRYRTHEGAVRIALRYLKVQMRPPGTLAGGRKYNQILGDEQIKQILYMDIYHPEVTLSEMGKHFGVSRERIRQICFSAGHITRREKFIPRAMMIQEQRMAKKIARSKYVGNVSKAWKSGMSMSELSIVMHGKILSNNSICNRISYLRNKFGIKMFPYRRNNHWTLRTTDERANRIMKIAEEWNTHGSIKRIQKLFGYATWDSARTCMHHTRRKWPHLFKNRDEIINQQLERKLVK